MFNKYEVVKFDRNLGASSSSLSNKAYCSVGDECPNDDGKACL